MSIKGALYNMGGWSQLFFFFFLTFTGYILAALIVIMCFHIIGIDKSPMGIRVTMLIQSVCLFLIPALFFSYLSQGKAKKYLSTDAKPNLQVLILSIVLIFAIQPFISFVSYYNQQLVLPESLSAIESWMRSTEQSASKTFDTLFVDKSIAGLIFNILIIAIMAGIAEEIFFRGCLQQIIQKIVGNLHLAVWITATIFSIVHFQFYGFVPRVLLGALLGYLFIWSRSIWVPILVHIVNNGIGVISAYLYYGTERYKELSDFNLGKDVWLLLFTLILSGLMINLIFKKYRKSIESTY